MAIVPFRRGGDDTIPITDGGTGGTNAASALANLGGLDETAHDALDHTGLTGVGGGVTLLYGVNAIQPLNNGNSPIGLMGIPANTLSFDGDWLLFNVLVRWASGATVDFTFTFGATTIMSRSSFTPGVVSYERFDIRIYRDTGLTARAICHSTDVVANGAVSTNIAARASAIETMPADWGTGLVFGMSVGAAPSATLNHWSCVKYDALVTPYP
jgi:hypothetical protein